MLPFHAVCLVTHRRHHGHWERGRATARKMWRQGKVFLLWWRLATLPLLDFEMLLDSVLELSYKKIVLNQNFGDGSIKIGLEGTLRSFSNSCACVKYGSAVPEDLWRWKCSDPQFSWYLTCPSFTSVIFLDLSARGGGTATSAAAVGTFRGCILCILPSPAQALPLSPEAAQVWNFIPFTFLLWILSTPWMKGWSWM